MKPVCFVSYKLHLKFENFNFIPFLSRYGWLCNHQPEIFGELRNSSFLEAHDGSEGKKGSPRILEIPNHQEEQLDGSCEDNRQQDHADDYLHSDVNELKASDEPTGLVVIFRSIYSQLFCLPEIVCVENGAFDETYSQQLCCFQEDSIQGLAPILLI